MCWWLSAFACFSAALMACLAATEKGGRGYLGAGAEGLVGAALDLAEVDAERGEGVLGVAGGAWLRLAGYLGTELGEFEALRAEGLAGGTGRLGEA
jgi:hypothetical protein